MKIMRLLNRVCVLGIPKTEFYILTLSPQKEIFGQFSTGFRKFQLKAGFNMGDFISKHLSLNISPTFRVSR